MVEDLRPCTGTVEVQRAGEEKEKEAAAAAGRKKGGRLGFGGAEGVL